MKIGHWITYIEHLVEDGIEQYELPVDWLLEFLRRCPEDMEVDGIPLCEVRPPRS